MGNVLEGLKGTPDGLRRLRAWVGAWWVALAQWWKRLTIAMTRKRLAKQLPGFDPQNEFNVAVVGMSGVGKSTLINALCKVRDQTFNPDVARTSRTGEATTIKKHTTQISTSGGKKIALWEIPGAGLLGQPIGSYFTKNDLHAFDSYIVVTGDRVTEVDMDVAKKAKDSGKPCIFVRNKADIALKSPVSVEDLKQLDKEFKNTLETNLKNSGLDPEKYKYFIVSAILYVDRNLDQNLNETQKALIKPINEIPSHLISTTP